jgi:hypothetical protein
MMSVTWLRLAFRVCMPALLVIGLSVRSLSAATFPQQDTDKHLGVASCASSTCHGAVSESKDSNVWRNEYRVWSKHDSHAQAFKVLQNAQSKAIAAKLGIGDPTKAKECLDCHADNVSAAARGPKFQISDGVGCEACHGGSEKWIKTHTEPGVSHADNLAQGMYPTEDPVARAELCLSCHLGNDNQFATHRIMGAGHPRMSFELDTFTVLQPAHYSVDADYIKRKGEVTDARLWALGQVRAARRIASLLDSHWFKASSMVPEPSFFDCHACHHPMNDLRWQPSELGAGMPPGAIRLNDAPMSMLRVIAERLNPSLAQELLSSTRALHKASLQSKEAVVAAATGLRNVCDKLEGAIAAARFTPADLRAMMATLFAQSGNGEYRDYTSAEQAVMAIDMMVITLGAGDKVKTEMDKLYALVEDEHHFSPKEFSTATRSLSARFKGL